jgi:hypothetical protein
VQLVYVCSRRHDTSTYSPTAPDHRLLDRLLHARHPTDPLRWSRRHRAYLPGHCSAVAFLQQEPRGLATRAQRVPRLQYRRGRTEGGIDYNTLDNGQGRTWAVSHGGAFLSFPLNVIVHSTVECNYAAVTDSLRAAVTF